MLVKELCTMDAAVCTAGISAIEAARQMRQRHVGDLIVVDDPDEGRVPLGIVTDRDLAVEVLGADRDPATTTVGSLMRRPVVIAAESEEAAPVIERMRAHGVRRIPVVDDRGAVSGIVTLDDMLRHLADETRALLDVVEIGLRKEQRARR